MFQPELIYAHTLGGARGVVDNARGLHFSAPSSNPNLRAPNVHSTSHPFVVGKISTSITGDKLRMQRDWSSAHLSLV